MGIALRAGQTVTITMTSTAFDAILALYDLDGNVVATDDDSAGGSNARIVFTAAAADIFVIEAGSFAPSSTGAYTISIQ